MSSDTSPEVEARYTALLMQKTGEERLRMAFDMNAAARAMLESGLIAQYGPMSVGELRVQVFLRMYGDEIPEPRRSRVIERIRAHAAQLPEVKPGPK